ncbi:serine protease 44-like [Anopheles coustani]|uniref:serine protease 44-like n=1 Tax=Anopheles coustani TaxID=139045 RepID=UPI002659E6CB|nr:serine protease 44-like [Anopheles coustani]
MRKSVSKCPAGVGRLLALSVLVCWSFRPVAGQLDGSFWWMNSNLLKQAEALRESKDVKAIVITKDSELDEVRVGGNSLVDSDSPDCICVPLGRCAGSGTKPTGRDGLCGTESVCCRRNQIVTIDATTTTPTTTTSATIGSTVSTTKLKPVDSLIFDSDGPSLSLPETVSYKPIPPNESAHDPALLLELSNLLLSHSIADTFDASNNNALEIEPASTSGSNKEGNSETTTIKPAEIIDVHSQCGIKRNHVTSRIYFQDEDDDVPKEPVFGMTEYAEFPWTVAIYQLIRNGTFVYHCGGALLNRKVVVTAAHCVSNNRLHPSRYVVHAGDWDRRHKQERLPHQERTVSRIVVHPNYYSGALFNDVALLFFDEPFNDMTANVGPICLPSAANMSSYSNCVVTGWGGSPKQNRAQSVQQFSKLALLDQAHCEAKLRDQPSLGRKFKLHESFVCADVDVTVDLCQGSGGSPLVCEKNGHYHLIGLVSWGIGCGDGIPSVLSNVSALSEWIIANVS